MTELKTPLVSVIMPVYNARPYVGAAIESVLNQTFRDFELILVDDGATDGSGAICDTYAEKDARITVLHQKNGGICNARNHGMTVAKGTYLAFCDHDDLYSTDYLETATQRAKETQAELVKFTYLSEYSVNGVVTKTYHEILPDQQLAVVDLMHDYYLLNGVVRALWNGLYLFDPIQKHNIRFDETIRAGMEDYCFNLNLLPYIDSVAFMSSTLFTHFARADQSTSEKYDANRIDALQKALRQEIKLYRQYGIQSKLCAVWQETKYTGLCIHTLLATGCPKTEAEKISDLQGLKGICKEEKTYSGLPIVKGHLKLSVRAMMLHVSCGLTLKLYEARKRLRK